MTPAARYCLAFVLGLASAPAAVSAQENGAPLSAIDWLEQALREPPPPAVAPEPPPQMIEPSPVLPESHFETITVAPLTGAELDATGLFTAERIGLPREFWGPSPLAEIIPAIEAIPGDTLPSAARLGLRLLMAEFAAPYGLTLETRGTLLLARIDKLVSLGALEQASQLIDAAAEPSAALRARAFDISLLLGEEDRACARMSGMISATEGQAAQIFCMARHGEWQAAWTSLKVARSLGLIDAAEAGLLMRFLDEEEADFLPPPPQNITPLGWRILEALGDPVATTHLPVAFAHADLRGVSGWRAQLDAAERLTRMEVLQANRLHGLYTQRRPAASGGMWERVRAMQGLDRALAAKDSDAISAELVEGWPLFAAVELEGAFATIHATALADVPLTAEASEILWAALLLAQERLDRAAELAPDTPTAQFVMALARGAPLPEIDTPEMASAIWQGFQDAPLSEQVQAQKQEGALGLIVLEALTQIAQAAAGDPVAATRGLQRLRAVGLESAARQIAIELLLLERRG
ncbi:hypothetical protein [Natronohydrobacter thiooxidans]|uniref:hypothetical protein n=1 Tax=Natronohydrobacter thiooxidans TaxID=87172 RepID=UPI0008FF78BD|nr:hypothetical protein [Natronohydrobacter thiooxidans]